MPSVLKIIERKPLLSLSAFFLISRAILYIFFPFRVDFLPWLNQLLDINLLKNDLWHSLSLLHSTPPLYNAFVGLIVSVFPETLWGAVFQSLYFLMGLGMVLITYRIIRFFKLPLWAGIVGALLLILNPILLRFETIPFYTYPLAFLILLSVWLLIRFIEKPSARGAIWFLLTPLVILLFRNFFHVIFYFLPIILGFCFLVYKTRKELLVTTIGISILFLGIGLLPNIKNQIEYGIFSSSTWQGMQLFSMTYFVPKEKIEALVAEQKVTPLALIPRFKNPDIYYDYYHALPQTGEPAINALYKSAGGGTYGNFNNWIYARAAKEYGEDTWVIMTRYPEYFIERFVNSVYIFFGFANYRYFDQTNLWLVFDGNMFKKIYEAGKYFITPAALVLLFFWSIGQSVLKLFSGRYTWRSASTVLIYLVFTLLYVFGVANVVELGENYTARVPIDPLLTVLAVILGYEILKSFRTAPRGLESGM